MRRMPEIIFQPEGKRRRVTRRITVLEAAKLLGVDLTSICGGQSSCGKCKIVVETGRDSLTAYTEAEWRLLSETELEKGYRLACNAKVINSVVVTVPSESQRGHQRLQVEGIETPVKLNALIKKVTLTLPKPSLEDQTADVERLQKTLEKQYGLYDIQIGYDLLRKLPQTLRESEWTITVSIWNNQKIIDFETGTMADDNYGFAVDIGTTKIAGYLIDLNKGTLISKGALMNPQVPFGEDIISRISYALESDESLRELQEIVVKGVNQILAEVCSQTAISHNHVYEATIVGNTVMHHLFMGISPKFVGLSPYTPAIQKSIDVKASKLGLKMNPRGNVHVLPVVAGFVGADCVAAVLATGIYKSSDICFLIDIGTNTEVVIGSKDGLVATSCASGPAFEGAHIKYGMRAQTGAIEKIWINSNTREPRYLTIDDDKPRGICGSAIVDVVAELLKTGLIDTAGKILTDTNCCRIREGPDNLEYVLAWKEEATTEDDIVIVQSDIREIQKAKAAMYTGASILMKKLDLAVDDINKVFIAGAFGTYIDPANAKTIGMFPDIPIDKIVQVGNAAGTGARMVLLSKDARNTAGKIRKKVQYVELANDPNFHREYLKALYFPHLDLDCFPRTVKMLRKTLFHVAPNHQTVLKGINKMQFN